MGRKKNKDMQMPEVFLHAREHKDLTTGSVTRDIGIEVYTDTFPDYLNEEQTEFLIKELTKALEELKKINKSIA